MTILSCVSRSVIFWKIQSCDKKFLFPKQPVDLSNVGKVVPNKGEELPYQAKVQEKFMLLYKHYYHQNEATKVE